MGCAIYVTDQNTGRMLFANQILKNTFAKELMDHNFDALLQSSIHKDKTRTVSVVYHAEKETWYDLLCKEIAWVDGKKPTCTLCMTLQIKSCTSAGSSSRHTQIF